MLASLQDRRVLAGIALFFVLLGVYMLTYRGMAMSGDEIFIFDSMESLARRGYLDRTYEYNLIRSEQVPPRDSGTAPWLSAMQEPLATVLGLPFFWLAERIPGVGMLHTVWLYNLFITAFTGASLYAAGMLLGYSARASWLAGLLFGIGTIAWTYSNLLFREPTMMFFTLWVFALAVYIRQHYAASPPWYALILMGISLIGALLAKSVTLLLLPGLFVVLLPPAAAIHRHWRTLMAVLFVVGGVSLAVIFLMSETAVSGRYALANLNRFRSIDWAYTFESLLGYQISPARSLWLYSPVLLLGLWGGTMLIRWGQWRIVLGGALAVLIFSAWYGLAYTFDWRGGWSWGPRYMLPLIPILILWTLPVLERLITERSRWLLAIVGFLVFSGAFIQIVGMAVPLSNYYTDAFFADVLHPIRDETFDPADWHWAPGNWTLEWMPIYYHITRIDFSALNFAWAVASRAAILTLLLAFSLIGLSGLAALRWLNDVQVDSGHSRKWQGGAYIGGVGLISMVMIASGLYSIRIDPRIIRDSPDIHTLTKELAHRTTGDDIIFLEHTAYTPIFKNYFKTSDLVATLPYAPAERYTVESPEVSQDAPIEEQLTPATAYVLDWSANHHERLWFVTESSPFETNKVRPIERYLVERYFPFSEFSTSSRARAVSFLTVDAPLDDPQNPLDATFGDMLGVTGFDLPAGHTFTPGDILPISLLWEPVTEIDRDYNIGLYLVNPEGIVYAQRDGLPQATFGRTSTWQTGASYRDNHGLRLPLDLPTGDYRLLLAVYYWEDGERLSVITSSEDAPQNDLSLARITIR